MQTLREALERRSLRQVQIIKAGNYRARVRVLDSSRVANIVNGKVKPTARQIVAIRRALEKLGVPPSEIDQIFELQKRRRPY